MNKCTMWGGHLQNKKAFTLIELLAVIVILAIIALIAVPIVINIIENSKLSQAERSMENFVDAVKLAELNYQTTNYLGKAGSWEEIKDLVKLENGDQITNKKAELDKTGEIISADATISEYYCMYTKGKGIKCKKVNLKSFSEDTWETVVFAFKSGSYKGVYNVGDEKEIDMGKFGHHIVRISNLSTPEECNELLFSQSACGIVLEFSDIITKHNMNSTSTNVGGWPASEMYTYLKNEIYNALPKELREGIIETTVVSGFGPNDINNFTSTDKLYLLSTTEVLGENNYSDTARNFTRQLDYYEEQGVTTSNYSKALKQYSGSIDNWWLRSAGSTENTSFYIVWPGGPNYYGGNSLYGVSPAFRLG